VRIAKAVEKNCRIGKTAFEGLELLAGKLARAVLRGLVTGDW